MPLIGVSGIVALSLQSYCTCSRLDTASSSGLGNILIHVPGSTSSGSTLQRAAVNLGTYSFVPGSSTCFPRCTALLLRPALLMPPACWSCCVHVLAPAPGVPPAWPVRGVCGRCVREADGGGGAAAYPMSFSRNDAYKSACSLSQLPPMELDGAGSDEACSCAPQAALLLPPRPPPAADADAAAANTPSVGWVVLM